ncbi:hypothetical protein FB565_000248 [Actinoplanes lutulentus]|uniref:DUF6924 domain-containing protein n=1 Tax=Actinoplanes lutulentus TaxID=1287878 RepID=A0A327YUW6_9ACTN|nr:hypothetical protein [Actinoplanes lutulentus]MBB2940544.1 hypothetical protein [Actinoplanes lutulentus]RAK24814.1 hypothetical protein B0I29_13520 [Actinoplanes lutulentus]
MWLQDSEFSLVIRTDFAHSGEWVRIRSAIAEPQTEDEFAALVTFVDDPANDGLTVPRLLEKVPAGSNHAIAFLVDAKALTHPDSPVLVVNIRDGATFRAVPSEMWTVQSNLALANMDWEDFATSVNDDGILRGFD